MLSNYNSSNSDHEIVTSYEEDVLGSARIKKRPLVGRSSRDRDIFDYEYSTSYYRKKKRLPNTGSNFSKIPILAEIPKIPNPAAWVSSKTQKDTKPIRN